MNCSRSVPLRLAETVRFLCERGLPFRGTNEKVGSHNGLFLRVLELILKFNPSLANHINTYA